MRDLIECRNAFFEPQSVGLLFADEGGSPEAARPVAER